MSTAGPTIVYVHGAGAQDPEAKLHGDLDSALGLGGRVPSSVAYYSDIRHPKGKKPNRVRAAVVNPKMSADEAAAAVVASIKPAPDYVVVPEDRDAARAFVATVFRGADELAGFKRVAAAKRRVLDIDGPADAAAYLWFGWAGRMRERVAARIAEIQGPLVVVAHSLGSIIAHDVLSAPPGANREVRLFFTAGSPLGMGIVQERLVGRVAGENRVPPPVPAWVNAYDPEDLVPWYDPILADDFTPSALVRDMEPVDNQAPNHHDLPKYLCIPAVRKAVLGPIGLLPASVSAKRAPGEPGARTASRSGSARRRR